jgi:hypothetical protein
VDEAADVRAFYDPVKKQVIDLPENWLGVAARIAAMSWDMKLLSDRTLLDSLLDRAAMQFTSGALYADDALPTGRYDRYSNEYVRYVWEAAKIAGRSDLLDKLRPSIRAQMRLWWDLVHPDGWIRMGTQPGHRELPRHARDRRLPRDRTRVPAGIARRPRRHANLAWRAFVRTTRTIRTCCRSSISAAATSPTSAATVNGSRTWGSWQLHTRTCS